MRAQGQKEFEEKSNRTWQPEKPKRDQATYNRGPSLPHCSQATFIGRCTFPQLKYYSAKHIKGGWVTGSPPSQSTVDTRRRELKRQVDLSEVEMCECETAEGNRISR